MKYQLTIYIQFNCWPIYNSSESYHKCELKLNSRNHSPFQYANKQFWNYLFGANKRSTPPPPLVWNPKRHYLWMEDIVIWLKKSKTRVSKGWFSAFQLHCVVCPTKGTVMQVHDLPSPTLPVRIVGSGKVLTYGKEGAFLRIELTIRVSLVNNTRTHLGLTPGVVW
jgi:hypothetical protein